jgi:hypothetical protein
MDRVAEGMSDRRKRYACIAARRFNDRIALPDHIVTIRRSQDVECHPVFNTTRKIQVLGLGKYRSPFALVMTMDSQQGRVADQALDIRGANGDGTEMSLKITEIIPIHAKTDRSSIISYQE